MFLVVMQYNFTFSKKAFEIELKLGQPGKQRDIRQYPHYLTNFPTRSFVISASNR